MAGMYSQLKTWVDEVRHSPQLGIVNTEVMLDNSRKGTFAQRYASQCEEQLAEMREYVNGRLQFNNSLELETKYEQVVRKGDKVSFLVLIGWIFKRK